MRRALVPVIALLAVTGCGGGSTASTKKVDPKDPTPGTAGRMTVDEERGIDDCANYVGETIASSSSYELLPAKQQDYMVETLTQSCWRMKGVDADDIKRRNAEARAEGYQ